MTTSSLPDIILDFSVIEDGSTAAGSTDEVVATADVVLVTSPPVPPTVVLEAGVDEVGRDVATVDFVKVVTPVVWGAQVVLSLFSFSSTGDSSTKLQAIFFFQIYHNLQKYTSIDKT